MNKVVAVALVVKTADKARIDTCEFKWSEGYQR